MSTVNSLKENLNPEFISPATQEFISFRPNWIIRNGNFLLLIIIFIILSACWWINYPDIVKGSLRLVSVKPPKILIAKSPGLLKRLFVSNHEQVKKGQFLAFLQSTADYDEFIQLQGWIDSAQIVLKQGQPENLLMMPLPSLSSLGELQSAYQDFSKIYFETSVLYTGGYFGKKRKSLEKEIGYLNNINLNTRKQQELLSTEYDLQKVDFNAQEKLAKEKIIAPLEFNQEKIKLLTKSQSLEQMKSQIENNEILVNNKHKEIFELQKYLLDNNYQFRSSLFTLKNEMKKWMEQYLIIAPEDGKVLFTSFLQENQLLSTGQELLYVQPAESNYYGELMVAQNGIGKIKQDQRVIVRIEGYPSNQFGYLNGTISYISEIPTRRDSFLIKVDLVNGLNTNLNKSIQFRNNLIAQAEVVTDDRKLIERFYESLRGLFDR